MKDTVRIVAIDPGERWVGIAALALRANVWKLEMGQLERLNTTLTPVVEVIDGWRPTLVAVEKFQHRPQGHQSFDAGEVLQLIGAIRYITEQKGLGYIEQMPAPSHSLTAYPIYPLLMAWDRDVSGHVHSAWRVLMDTLHQRLPDRMLQLFHHVKKSKHIKFESIVSEFPCIRRSIDLALKFSPAVSLKIARAREVGTP